MGQSAGDNKMIENNISKEMLEDLYINQKLSLVEIAKILKVSQNLVSSLKKKYAIRTINAFERHHKQVLGDREKSIILGLMLGDGHIKKHGNSNPTLMLEQTQKHSEYIYWLRNELMDWVNNPEKPITHHRKFCKRSQKFYHSLSFQTISHPVFNEFHSDFYKDKKKVVGKETMKYFNELTLAVWIMDDGFLTGTCKRNAIATNCFSFDDVNFLRDLLKSKYDLKTWANKRTTASKKLTWEISFDRPSTVKIAEIIRHIVVPSMQYKLLSSETTKGTVNEIKNVHLTEGIVRT